MNIKKYELSIWQDLTNTTSYDSSALYLFNTGGIRTSVNEKKLCIIGSDTMISNGRARNVNLTRNVNGSNSITFSVLLRYPSYNEFHPDALDKETHITKGEFVKNPIVDLLQADTKLKMWLPENKQNGEDEWLEFLIKKVEEDSATGEIRYTATDLFINELARTGYNLAFSTEAGNNMGTAWELTEKILEDSDWVLDKDNSDRIINDKTKVFTPFYVEKFAQQYWFDKYMNLSTYKKKTINNNRIIFLLAKDEFLSSGQKTDVLGYIVTQGRCVTIDGTNNHLNREQIVFQDKTYNISDFMKIIQDYYKNNELSLIATPILFPIRYNQTKKEYYYGSEVEQRLIEYDIPITLPNVLDQSPLLKYDNDKKRYYQQFCNIDVIKQLTGSSYTKVNRYINTRTFSPHFPQSIIEGIKFAQNTDTQIQTISLNSLKNMIDKLDRDYFLISYPQIGSTSQIIENENEKNWYISWETKNKDQSAFHSVPITQEIYSSNSSSKWEKQNFGLSNIKYALGKLDNESLKTLQSAIRSGVTKFSMGFDIGTLNKIYDLSIQMVSSCLKEINGVYKESLVLDNIIENIQEEEKDEQGKLISKLITPMYKEMVIPQYSFYDEAGKLLKEIYEGMTNPYPYPVIDPYNQKVTQIEESDSNRFNLLQTICENFKCWMKINVRHRKDGRLETQNWYFNNHGTVLNSNGYFHEENGIYTLIEGLKSLGAILASSIDEAKNKLGITESGLLSTFSAPVKTIQIVNSPNPTEAETAFKYGENLNSIKRTVNSEQISTYVIVEDNEIEQAEGGVCSIRDASNNPSMENAIINFDYYTSIGLLDKNEVYKDLYGNPTYDKNNLCYYWFTRNLNNRIKALVTEYNKAADELMNLKASVDIATGEVAGAYNSILKESNNLNATSNKKVSLDISKALKDIENKKIGLNKVINSITNKQPTYFNNITYKELDYLEIIYDEYNAKGNYIYYTRTGNSEKDYVYTPLTSKPSRPQSKYYSPAKNNKEIGALLDNKTVQSLLTNINKFLTQYYSSNQKATIFTDLYTTKKARVDIIESQLQTLRNEKQMHYNKFYQKYQAYIQEGLWSETIYVNPDQYYAKALDVAETSAKPQITYDIQVTDLSVLDSYQKGNNNSYKVELGQVTYVEDPYFFGNYQELVIITEIAYNFDNPEQTKITVQNYRTRFEDLFQRLSASVQTLQYADYAYNKLSNILAPDGTILLDNLQQAIARNGLTLKNVSGQEVVQDETGITITSKYEPQKMLRIVADGIYVSRDSGNTFVNALSIDGISADVITSGVLDTQQIIISNGDKATFRWDSDGLTAFKWSKLNDEGEVDVDLSKFVRYDQYGIYGVDTLYYGWVANNIDEIESQARFGLTWNGFFFNCFPDWTNEDVLQYGGVRLDELGLYGLPMGMVFSDWRQELSQYNNIVDKLKYIENNATFGAIHSGFFINGKDRQYRTKINETGYILENVSINKELIHFGILNGETSTQITKLNTLPSDWETTFMTYYMDQYCTQPWKTNIKEDGKYICINSQVFGALYKRRQITINNSNLTLNELATQLYIDSSTVLDLFKCYAGNKPGYLKELGIENLSDELVFYPKVQSNESIYKITSSTKNYGVRFNDLSGNPVLNYNAANGQLDLSLNSLVISWNNFKNNDGTNLNSYLETSISSETQKILNQVKDLGYISANDSSYTTLIKDVSDLNSNYSTLTETIPQLIATTEGALYTLKVNNSRNILPWSRYYYGDATGWAHTATNIGVGISSNSTHGVLYYGPPSGVMSYRHQTSSDGNSLVLPVYTIPASKEEQKYYILSFYYRSAIMKTQLNNLEGGGTSGNVSINIGESDDILTSVYFYRINYNSQKQTYTANWYKSWSGLTQDQCSKYNLNTKQWNRYCVVLISDKQQEKLIKIRCGQKNSDSKSYKELSGTTSLLHEFSSFQLEEISPEIYNTLIRDDYNKNGNTTNEDYQVINPEVLNVLNNYPSPWVESPSDAFQSALGLVKVNDHVELIGAANKIKLVGTQTIDISSQIVNIQGMGLVNIAGQEINLCANNEIRLSTGNQGKIIFDTPKFQWQEASIGMEIDTSDRENIQLKLGNWQVTKDNLQRVEDITIHTSNLLEEVAYDIKGQQKFTFSSYLSKYLQEPIPDGYIFRKARAISSKKPEYLLPIYSPSAMKSYANKFYGRNGFIYWATVEENGTITIIDPPTYFIYQDDILRDMVVNIENKAYTLYWRNKLTDVFQSVNADTIYQIQQSLNSTAPISTTPSTFQEACRLSLKCVIDYYITKDETNNYPYFMYTQENETTSTRATHLIGKDGIKITTNDKTLLKLDGSETGLICRWEINGSLTIGGNDNTLLPQDCDYIYFDYNKSNHTSRTVDGIRSLIAEGGVLISANYGRNAMRLQGKVIDLWTDSVYIRQLDPESTTHNYAPGRYGVLCREPDGQVRLLNGKVRNDYGKSSGRGSGTPGGGGIVCITSDGVPYIWSWTDSKAWYDSEYRRK